MNAIEPLLRGPRACRLLERFGIDSRRYWLLIDLFGQLSERGEMLDQLGNNKVALKTVTWIYFAMSGLFSLIYVLTRAPATAYFMSFLALTTILLLSVLLSETGNSLLNPVEGLVLAHQPIDGMTYTAAKLTHLVRIVIYLVLGLNAIPALGGLAARETVWTYPFLHLLASLAAGVLVALTCCAVFGWLMRFVPAPRLKATAQLAATVPFIAMIWWPALRDLFAKSSMAALLPARPAARWGLVLGFGVFAAAVVALGIRSLSADYLIRVSGLTRGGSAAGARQRRSWLGPIVARFFGAQAGRAGFAFTSRMMLRDWQFRRQALPTITFAAIGLAPLVAKGWRTDPFSGAFSLVHLVPHLFGLVLFFTCNLLPYGNDYKGAWIFLLAPARAIPRFARGVHALLWIGFIVLPHLVLLVLLAWAWGPWHGALFILYSVALASAYLSLELRLIDGAPFTRQMDTSGGAALLPLLMLGALVIGVAVGLQYLLVFRSAALVMAATAVLGAAANFLTRSSLAAFATSIRYNLALNSAEAGTFYKEVEI